eukprot:9443245-Pyramimonas_sp.AAC.1
MIRKIAAERGTSSIISHTIFPGGCAHRLIFGKIRVNLSRSLRSLAGLRDARQAAASLACRRAARGPSKVPPNRLRRG